MNDAYFCYQTGMSLQDYRQAPAWFIRDLWLILDGEAIAAKEQQRQMSKKR